VILHEMVTRTSGLNEHLMDRGYESLYNIRVLTPKSEREAAQKHHRHAVYASETTGLLLIAFVLLVLTIVRYWHEIHWSLR
jgi:hypothetical protein